MQWRKTEYFWKEESLTLNIKLEVLARVEKKEKYKPYVLEKEK